MDKNIIDFLIKAKRVTYAGKGAETESSRPNSHDLQYVEGKLKYIDTYLGGLKFAGQEALWNENIPFWSMNYTGRVIGNNFSGNFLKEALLNVTEEYPFRGPLHYKNVFPPIIKLSCKSWFWQMKLFRNITKQSSIELF